MLVLRPVAESSLQKIIHLIKDAQQRKAPAQQFTDRFGSYYTYSVLGLSFVMFFVWWLGFGQAPFAARNVGRSAFYHAMTLLVVASPCALVLSIPSAVLAAIAWGARHGILFRGGAAIEKLAAINTVALDKTGTLTTGELGIETVESFPPGREPEVARLAFSLERLSTHPLGARHRPARQTTRPATLGVDPLRIHHRPGPARPAQWRRLPAGPPRMAGPGSTCRRHRPGARHRSRLLGNLAHRGRFCWAGSSCATTSARKRVTSWKSCTAKVCAPLC